MLPAFDGVGVGPEAAQERGQEALLVGWKGAKGPEGLGQDRLGGAGVGERVGARVPDQLVVLDQPVVGTSSLPSSMRMVPTPGHKRLVAAVMTMDTASAP